jgi:hypothetical protein
MKAYGEEEVHFTHFQPWQDGYVNGQLHTPAALPLRQSFPLAM